MAVESITRRTVPPISAMTLRFFRGIVRRYFRRHFRSVMILHADRMRSITGPLVVYANHSSWWDPMVSVLLTETLLPARPSYAPMDADALAKYPILKRIGIFPVEMQTARGAAQFLRTSIAILESGGVVWITPQGRFADPRAPLNFKPGLGALASRFPGLTLLPLAIEYPFWNERLPETLLALGKPVQIVLGTNSETATALLEAALAATMATLQVAVLARQPSAFEPLLTGARGTGGIYAIGRRLRSWLTGKQMVEDHTVRDTVEDHEA